MRARLAAIRGHARHLVLAALVAGLLLGPLGPAPVLAAAAVMAALAGRSTVALLAAAAVLGGAALADARLAALDAGHLASMHGDRVDSRAVLLEPLRARGGGRSVARVRLLDGPGADEQAVLRVRGPVRPAAARAPEVGDVVAVIGRVAPLGVYDAYQRRRNAHAAVDASRVVATGARRGGPAGALDSVRRRGEAGLERGLAPPEAALLRGMVLGEDERLTEEVRDEFQRSGLAHILAVSGANVMLLAVLVLGACALFGVPLRTRLVLAAALIVIYVPLAGGGPSIQRAGVMGVAGLIAALAGRPARRWYALLLAAAVTLVLNPRAAGEPGWQLSFAAVVALLVGAPPLREALGRRMPAAIADAAAITIAATIGTAPLMALYFHQVSLASLPANLLAAPAIAPIMWLGVLAAAAAQLAEPLAAPFTALAAPLLVYVQRVAHHTAAAPFAAIDVTASPLLIAVGWVVLVVAAGLALRRLGRRSRRAWRRPLVVVAAIGAVAVVVAPTRGAPAPGAGEVVVTFLDVGQGDATLIQRGATSILIDTGVPDGPVLQRLQEAGIGRLDALILTHAEADHEGAAPRVIAAHHPRLVINGGAGWPSSTQRALAHTRSHVPAAGEVIALGGLRFEVLWPPARTASWRATGNPNDNALVARLEAGRFSMLLAADAESGVTAPLSLEPVDVLKVAHHGSADPGLPALLERLKPRIAAIEVGRENTYGHPAPSTIAALRAAVPTVLRTDRDGTTRLHAAAGRIWIDDR